MSAGKTIRLAVGDHITTPPGVARNGRIRIRSVEAAEVAALFELGRKLSRRRERRLMRGGESAVDLVLAPGTMTLLTGGSGAGKSTLLRDLRKRHAATRRWIDMNALRLANVPIVNCFDGLPLLETLKLLARVGLGEAWSYLRTPRELSEGQKFRLKLALAMHRAVVLESKMKNEKRTTAEGVQRAGAGAILVCDEFAALLDRLTAMIVARCLRKTIDAHPHLAAVVATSHDDLIDALSPDVVVRCDFGSITVQTRSHEQGA